MNFAWRMHPFPHLIIDNYLCNSDFLKLRTELENIYSSRDPSRNFCTSLEDKQLYALKSLGRESEKLVSLMGSSKLKNLISHFFDFSIPIISLGDTDNFSGYSPYHVTKSGGHLGSHIDHSYVDNDLIHIANTIFYASSDWKIGWGGETVFYSSFGSNKCEFVEPLPNRLVLFIHTSESFHGVDPYRGPDYVNREIFYHDYYIQRASLANFAKAYHQKIGKKALMFPHGTVFFPKSLIKILLPPFSFSKIKGQLVYFLGYLIYFLKRHDLQFLISSVRFFSRTFRISLLR